MLRNLSCNKAVQFLQIYCCRNPNFWMMESQGPLHVFYGNNSSLPIQSFHRLMQEKILTEGKTAASGGSHSSLILWLLLLTLQTPLDSGRSWCGRLQDHATHWGLMIREWYSNICWQPISGKHNLNNLAPINLLKGHWSCISFLSFLSVQSWLYNPV